MRVESGKHTNATFRHHSTAMLHIEAERWPIVIEQRESILPRAADGFLIVVILLPCEIQIAYTTDNTVTDVGLRT